MVKLYPTIKGRGTLERMRQSLRDAERQEEYAAPHLAPIVASEARWQWALDGERYIAGCAIIPDGLGRGWLVAYPGAALDDGLAIRPLLKLFRQICRAGVYHELRAWVAAEDPRAIAFAEAFGFVYDCGPATGYSPTGRDMNLYLWRQKP